MAKKKKITTTKKKKATSKKRAGSIIPANGRWIQKHFIPGDLPGSDKIKKKVVENYYDAYLRAYNENGGSPNGLKFYILKEPNGFIWDKQNGEFDLDVYITPPPIPPGAGRADPPDPSQPPPDMP